MCARCRELETTVTIDSPASLAHVLAVVRDNLADGTLVESSYWPPGQIEIDRPAFASLPAEGPWPDYLEYWFECASCGQLFRLEADTYHGHGGTWSPRQRAT